MNDPDETIDSDDYGTILPGEFDTIDSSEFDPLDPDATIDPNNVARGGPDSVESSDSSDPFETWEDDSEH